jgi:hypothetical protein
MATRPEAVLMLPHGSTCLEGFLVAAQWDSSMGVPYRGVLFVDKMLRIMVPAAHALLHLHGLTPVVLSHVHIEQTMKEQTNLMVFPGGFAEIVGGTDKEQFLNLTLVSYWLKQCRKHGYTLRIIHVYNGSDTILQSSFYAYQRFLIALRYHVPLLMPVSYNHVGRYVARCLVYTEVPETVDVISADLTRYVNLDKQSPLFPAKYRKYTMVTHV